MISFVVCRNYVTFASIIKSCRPTYIKGGRDKQEKGNY